MAPTFQVLRITAHCDNPIRNSAKQLIFGDNVLWEGKNTHDGDKGSLAPNVFSYDFKSAVPSSIKVTIKHTGDKHVGSKHCLHGLVDGHKIIASDLFAVESTGEATVAAKIVDPHMSQKPFSWNADVSWELAEEGSTHKTVCAEKTRLELYWIWGEIHEIFLSGNAGIPVELLRSAIPSLTAGPNRVALNSDPAIDSWATNLAFGGYNKRYDTMSGAPHFGVSYNGGYFYYSYYVQAAAGRGPGSLYPIVNCYDQAAMVQVLTSFNGPTASWLYQDPYGYINTTYLVGIGNCNNPFFQSNNTPQVIAVNSPYRTGFGNHAYNGLLAVLDRLNDRVYDACGGPHLGTETPQQYINAAIDPRTSPRPSIYNITQYLGVTGYGASVALKTTAKSKPSEHVQNLVKKCSVDTPKPHFQAHWDDLPNWAKTVLGDRCEVAYHEVNVAETQMETLWHLTGVSGSTDGNVVVRAEVLTRVGGDGKLDTRAASTAASEHLITEVKNTQLDLGSGFEHIDKLWVPAELDDFGETSVRYADDVLQGRVLIVSGNSLVDIRGGTSSKDLVSVARSLLKHTTAEKPVSLDVPHVTRHSNHIPEANRGSPNDETVKGIGSRFEIVCHVEGRVTSASAHVGDNGLLLSGTTISIDAGNDRSKVVFLFVTRKLGTHVVDLLMVERADLKVFSEKVEVKVVA